MLRAAVAFLFWLVAACASHAAVALDGHKFTHFTATSGSATLTTSNANDVIIVCGWLNSSGTVVGSPAISDNFNGGGGLTWTSRYGANDNTNSVYWYISWANASSAISSGSVTVDVSGMSGLGNFYQLNVFGVSGANTSTPFDPQGGSVFKPVASGLAPIATQTANDFVFGFAYITGTPGTVGGGWTKLDDQNATFYLSEDQIASGTGTFTVNVGGGTLFAGSIIDAVVPASGGGASTPSTLRLLGVGK